MNEKEPNFDLLAKAYLLLERVAFGRDLERARFCNLELLTQRKDILVLGEGDGRCLERLRFLAPKAKIHCVDSSKAMIARASERLRKAHGLEGVTFTHADALKVSLEANRYDAVTTFFFLDCFTDSQVKELVDRVGRSLRPDSLWLLADFAIPARGILRLRAKAWLFILYSFFRIATGIVARKLPLSEEILTKAGWRKDSAREFQRGLLRAVTFSRSSPVP